MDSKSNSVLAMLILSSQGQIDLPKSGHMDGELQSMKTQPHFFLILKFMLKALPLCCQEQTFHGCQKMMIYLRGYFSAERECGYLLSAISH